MSAIVLSSFCFMGSEYNLAPSRLIDLRVYIDMNRLQQSAVVPYTPVQMFDLVNGVSEYPNFLPWCGASRIEKQEGDSLEATLDIVWAGLKKSFTTRNTLTTPDRIDIDLAKGPFRHLKGVWTFERMGMEDERGEESCKVSLVLEFELSGGILDMMFQPVFLMIANSMVDAFCKRATVVYGNRCEYRKN